MQWPVVNTLFQGKMDHHNQEDGSWEPQKNGPVLEVTTSCLHGKHGVEIRIWSLSGDNTHSWVRISHGSNKFVMDSNDNDTEVPEDQLEEQALQLDAEEICACQPKAKAKPQRKEPADSSSRIIQMNRRNWIDIQNQGNILSLCVRSFEESNSSSSSFSASTTRRRRSSSILEDQKNFHQNQFPQVLFISLDDRWKACLEAGGGAKRRYPVLH